MNSFLLLIGANHITIRWRLFVVREQITPITQSRRIVTSTVCAAVLAKGGRSDWTISKIIHDDDDGGQ